MKVFTTKQLNAHLNEKGIAKKHGDSALFFNNDYFQVVNAYKALFISGVENINDILKNIDNNQEIKRYKKAFAIGKIKDNAELKRKILLKICEKYNISSKANQCDIIEKLNYVHHIYSANCTYNDFLRMYYFEHELRSLLLKYTLTIENNLKRVLIKTLNDKKNMKDSFITDIDSYNTSVKSHNEAIKTLKNILDIHNSKHSKPVGRKIEQDIIVPYWILINEMTFGVVINCIKNLKKEYSELIYENLIKEFTKTTLSFSNKQDIHDIENFKKILDYISTFRNILAHNQPIFAYNIKDDSLCNFPSFSYSQPQISKKHVEAKEKSKNISSDKALLMCQHSKNNHMKDTFKVLFGKDNFNKDKNPSNMNLSYIIYLIYKINKQFDATNTMKQELIDLFYSYNIIEHTDKYHIIKIDEYNALIKSINGIDSSLKCNNDLDTLRSNICTLNNQIKSLKKQSSLVQKEIVKRKYNQPFMFDKAYQNFTGITIKFLRQL